MEEIKEVKEVDKEEKVSSPIFIRSHFSNVTYG